MNLLIMKWIISITIVVLSVVLGVTGQECTECCVQDVDSYMDCYKQCHEECPADNCPSGGTRFGNQGKESYMTYTESEWDFLGDAGGNVNKYNVTIQFRTTASSGLVFFANSPPSEQLAVKDDYIGAHIWNGKLFFGSVIHSKFGRVQVESDKLVNDGTYHTASFFQEGDYIEMCVDGKCKDAISGRGNRNFRVRLEGTLFLGGAPDSLKASIEDRLTVPVGGLNGCVKLHTLTVDGLVSPPPGSRVNIRD